jgi:hypothetical protein
LDLVINTARSCPHLLSIEVLRARTHVVTMCIGLISFSRPGSLQVLLVILGLFSGGARNLIGIVLCILCWHCSILQEVQHVAFPQRRIAFL